jgi:hypothetical protein
MYCLCHNYRDVPRACEASTSKLYGLVYTSIAIQMYRDILLRVLIRPCCMLLSKASSSADWLIPASTRISNRSCSKRLCYIPSISLKLLPILGVPSLPSFPNFGPFCFGLPGPFSSMRWMDCGDFGVVVPEIGTSKSLSDVEFVTEDAVCLVRCDC